MRTASRSSRTTIRLNTELARRAKALAAKSGKTFTQVVESAMAEYVAKESVARPTRKIKLPVSGARGKPLTHEQVMAAIKQADFEYDMKKIGFPIERR